MTLSRHIVAGRMSMRECLKALNALPGGAMTLFVTDPDGSLIGSLTDGDIRRALIDGKSLDTPAESLCNRRCLSFSTDTDRYEVFSKARLKGISLVPVLRDGKVTALADLRQTRAMLPVDAVLMAGGKGERLRPLTLDTPKPLLPVGGQPIIDYNIRSLIANGAEKIAITVNYLKEKIIDHVEATYPEGCGARVECVAEPCRLGTIGSLALVDGLVNDTVVVMNSDLLTDISFERMYDKHISSGAEMTMAVVPYSVSVPYAIIEHTDDRITGFTEKPTYNYYANAGIYMLRRSVIKEIERGVYMDATDLVAALVEAGRKVSYFPIEGTWVDIGSPDDYRYACDMMQFKTPPDSFPVSPHTDN